MLSKKTKYGIKALSYLARKKDQGYILISEISEKEKIPKKFLENILLELKKKGFISSQKGKGGGYHIPKKLSEINLADVIRALDGPIALLPCASINYYEKCTDCPSEEECKIHKIAIEVRNETLSVLSNKTLEDLA